MASVPSAANEFLTSEEVIEVLQRDPGLRRVALATPPVRHIAAARLAASHRSAATASMLGVLRATARDFTPTG